MRRKRRPTFLLLLYPPSLASLPTSQRRSLGISALKVVRYSAQLGVVGV